MFKVLKDFLPHETVQTSKTLKADNIQEIKAVNKKEIQQLVNLLKSETLGYCSKAIETNSINDTKNFINILLKTNKNFRNQILKDYIQRLKQSIDTFDITQIQYLLNHYESLMVEIQSQSNFPRE